MITKIISLIFILAIFFCLGSGLYYMIYKKNNKAGVAKALTWRIALSFSLFLLLLIGFFTGWIHPHGIS